MSVKPISLHVDNDILSTHQPTAHQLRPYDVPFHLPQGFESELFNMIEAGILVQCDQPILWNTKAFPVPKIQTQPNAELLGISELKLYWRTESSNQLSRHIDPKARYFCEIDATSGFHQVPVDEEASKLLTSVTNSGRYSY